MPRTITFTLTRPAKKSGGDRYESDVPDQDKPFVVYVPQTISRSEDRQVLAKYIDITFDPK